MTITDVKPRVWDQLQHAAQWGRFEDGQDIGLKRESLSDDDRAVRDWFVAEAKSLGFEVKVDQMGNIFAILDGEDNSIPPIGMGSHLDSQPAGGRFDGSLGVVAALQVLRTVKESGIKTFAPLAAIDWTNEEGSRFPRMCTGSSVWAETATLEECHALEALVNPTATMRSELERINYLGDTPCSRVQNSLSAHFELHIEQGTRLEKAKKKVAVVKGVQGMRWYEIRCKGAEAHAGATPMTERADALTAIACFTLKVEEVSRRQEAFGTVGVLTTGTSSPNTVPGSAFCTLDLRHSSEKVLDAIEAELHVYLSQLEKDRPGISIAMKRTWKKSSVRFDNIARQCVRKGAEDSVGRALIDDLESHATHDSAETAYATPTAMIFVPSKNGVSHSPAEYTSEDDCDLGAEVLLKSVLLYDEHVRSIAEGKSSDISRVTFPHSQPTAISV